MAVKLQRRRLPCWVNAEPFDYKDYGDASMAPLSFSSTEECLGYIARVLKITDDNMYINKATGAVMWSGSVLGWVKED